MNLEDIKRNYTHIGTANSPSFKWPEGVWVRAYVNWSGTYEIHVCHEAEAWVDIFMD